jgi:hypothetical protein
VTVLIVALAWLAQRIARRLTGPLREQLDEAAALLDALGALVPPDRPDDGGRPAWLRELERRRQAFVARHADRLPE